MEKNFDVQEIFEGVNDAAEATLDGITDFFNPEGMEALENGDIDGAFEGSDLGKDGIELISETGKSFGLNMDKILGGVIVAVGTVGAVLTLPSPEPFTTGGFLTLAAKGAQMMNK